MNKVWQEPKVMVQPFVANEYVAACWKIMCNVPSGYGYIEKTSQKGYDKNDTLLTGTSWTGGPNYVHGCGVWHTGVQGVPDDGPTANAKWHAAFTSPERDYDVFYWRDGEGPNDIHFSKVEDAEWETNPNAS